MCLTVPCLEMGPSWVESVESTAENLGLALRDQWLPLSQPGSSCSGLEPLFYNLGDLQ